MADPRLQLQDHRTAFTPGEMITGTASWQSAERPAKAEVCLIWSTRGKGTTDIGVVETFTFSDPQAHDTRPFQIKLPEAPYSFSGQLISLLWTLELNLDPGDQCAPLEITIAPGGTEVLLPRIQA
jgi:hypothetical protein